MIGTATAVLSIGYRTSPQSPLSRAVTRLRERRAKPGLRRRTRQRQVRDALPTLLSQLQVWVALFLLLTPAFGQEPSPSPTAAPEGERIIVTGSYIPPAAEVGPNPILTLTREAIEQSGERTTEQLIKNLTVVWRSGHEH